MFPLIECDLYLLKQYVLIDIRGQAFPEVSAVYYRLDQFVSGFP